MRELWDALITLATRTIWALIFAVTIIGYMFYNLGSFNTIKNYSLSQYLRNIYTLQLWDNHYKVVKMVELYDQPVPILFMDEFTPELYILPGNVIEVTGTWKPERGEASWLAVRVFKWKEPVYGYILAPNGASSIFGGYTADTEYFESFDNWDTDRYKRLLAREFYNEIVNKYIIIIESDALEKQKMAELDMYERISSLIAEEIMFEGVRKYSDEYHDREIFCRKDDYQDIKDFHDYYFKRNYYPRLLDVYDIDGGWEM